MKLKYVSGCELTGVPQTEERPVYGTIIPAGENRILLIDTEEHCRCFDPRDGRLLWMDICNRETGREARHDEHITYHNGVIYSRREEKEIVAMNPADGEILWKYNGGFNYETFQGDFRFYEDRIMVFHTKNSVFAFDLNSHELLWKQKVQGLIQNDRCSFIWKNYYVVQTASKSGSWSAMTKKGSLVYLDVESGEVSRTVALGVPGGDGKVGLVGKCFTVHNDVLWYESQYCHLLCRFDLNAGKHLDARMSGCGIENFGNMELSIFGVSSFHIHNGKLYLSGAKYEGIENPPTARYIDRGIYECDIETREVKAINIEPGATSGFEIYRGRNLFLFYCQEEVSPLSVMDLTTGKKEGISIPNRPVEFCVDGDRIYLTGRNMIHTVSFSGAE